MQFSMPTYGRQPVAFTRAEDARSFRTASVVRIPNKGLMIAIKVSRQCEELVASGSVSTILTKTFRAARPAKVH